MFMRHLRRVGIRLSFREDAHVCIVARFDRLGQTAPCTITSNRCVPLLLSTIRTSPTG